MSTQKGSIRVQTENIFPIIKKFLYSDHEIFVRELVSNAVDATQKLKTLSSIGEAKGELGELRIDIKLDADKKTLTISDRGIGMTGEEIDKYLNQVAFSGAEEFVQKYRRKREAAGTFEEEETQAILELMRGMLRFRPEKRLTIDEVLRSEWMVNWALPQLE